MRFNHYGKTYQLRIETARDLAEVLHLDEALWVATSAPVSVFRCDNAFTQFLDTNRDGRINTREVRAAVTWLLDHLQDPSRLNEETDTLPLPALQTGAPDTARLIESAKRILGSLGHGDDDTITLEQIRTFQAHLQQQPMNGDSVIVPAAAQKDETAQYIRDVVACTGGTDDSSGEKGAAADNIDRFQALVTAYLDWLETGRVPEDGAPTELMPFGGDTPALYGVLQQHAEQVDLFFGLSRAVQFDERTHARFGCTDEDLQQLDLNNLDDVNACLARQPIARPAPASGLPLSADAVNPIYRDWIRELRARVLPAVLGREPEVLDELDWQTVKDRFAPYAAYLANKPEGSLERVPLERLRAYTQPACRDAAEEMIRQDQGITRLREGARELEQFLLYHKYLLRFVNNFVNFSQLYSLRDNAIFEMGAAVIDGRWFSLALKVDDLAAHQQLAATSNIFTMYVEVSGPNDDPKYTVAIPATSGSKGNLCVGKRGIFFDTQGREFNARIVKIIQNPISLREALLSPFSRLWEFVLGKIERMAGTSEADLQKQTDAMIAAPSTGAPAAAPTHGPAGMLVGLSLSAAAIGSAFAFVAKSIADMSHAHRMSSLLGAILVVAVPVTLIAVIKLRRQDLSSLLEGCGWAINARMRFNREQRRQFTRRVGLPRGATVNRRHVWRLWVLLGILIGVIGLIVYLYGQS